MQDEKFTSSTSLPPGYKWCKIPWPINQPCPVIPPPSEDTETKALYENPKSRSIRQSTVDHFVNYGIVDFDVKFEEGKVIVTLKVAGVSLGTLTLTTENGCGNLEGKVDVFGFTGAKVKVTVCADIPNRKVCANGKAYIYVPWPVDDWKEIGSFEECINF
ncbi:hypothetical protein [Bacillus amyloliquefaciens]|uniref:hypothetical protein n=1 Tax=Bacillus amyloliquefaciens TaxID=1390 RepID=UPI0024A44F67|nr:hypothetical protein [Bacillus amyloliquefaciens]GLZ63678.1 hypothetical protein Bamy02_07310 [Bacillus amyloliquefaciens]